MGLGRGGKIPPSGAREGEISSEYGCFYIGGPLLRVWCDRKNDNMGGLLEKNAHIEG